MIDDIEADAPRRSKTPLLIAIVVIVAAFGYLVYGGISKNLVWSMTPNELLAQGPDAYGHAVRLGGLVVPGSIVHNPDRLGLSFRMRDVTGPDILVHSTAIPTAMFRDGIGVVVEGKYQQTDGQAVFQATTLMVKHSNEYKAPAGMDSKKDDVMKTLLEDSK
jgi:cytochrome c-type biogenesis protein CcmE